MLVALAVICCGAGGDLLNPRGHVLNGLADRQERLTRLLDHRDAVLCALCAVLDDIDGLARLILDRAHEL